MNAQIQSTNVRIWLFGFHSDFGLGISDFYGGGQTKATCQNTRLIFERTDTMAEETPQADQQSVQVVLDERELKIIFSNAYRIHTTAEEVVTDLGFNMPDPNPQGGQSRLLFKVTDRVVMSYASTKRLAMSLTQLIKRYEQQFGEIQVRPTQK